MANIHDMAIWRMAYLVTGVLITSELKFMADYRILGLSNPRIIEPSDYRYVIVRTCIY